MLANPTIGLLGSYYQRIDRNGLVIDTAELPTSNSDIQRRLESGNIFQGAVMMRRSVLEKAGGYREYFRMSQDYDLWLRMAEISELAILPEHLYQYRFHSESISRKKREFQLACGRYALALALQRRSGVPEGPIPEDVTSVYKPEPERIFQDARGIVYLNLCFRPVRQSSRGNHSRSRNPPAEGG